MTVNSRLVPKGLTSQYKTWLISALVAALVCLVVSSVALAINAYQLSKSVPATVNILPLLPGDATGDGVVDKSDLDLVASAFNTSPPAVISADLNKDNIVDVHDLVIVGGNYGKIRK